MSVDLVLAQRARRAGRGPEAASLVAAVVLHVLLVAVALLLPRLAPPPKPLEFVPVTVLPAQALGVRHPAPPKQPPAPKPQETPTPEAAPTPLKAVEPTPAPPKPADQALVLPEKTDKKKPAPVKPVQPVAPAPTAPTKKTASPETAPGKSSPNSPPNATAAGETGDQAGRRGAPTGSPLGTTAFGSHLAGVDNPDFTYGYYLDRLLSLIDANWVRPPMGSGIRAIIAFRIQRDGSLTGLRVAESSGYNSFDLAALRAVQNAAPFPPLPRAYSHNDLGVNLIVY